MLNPLSSGWSENGSNRQFRAAQICVLRRICRATAGATRVSRTLAGGELGFKSVADRRGRRRFGRRAILLDFLAFDLFGRGAIAEADAARFRADLDDLEIVFFAGFERTSALQRASSRTEAGRAFVAAFAIFDFRVVAKGFDIFAQLDERPER